MKLQNKSELKRMTVSLIMLAVICILIFGIIGWQRDKGYTSFQTETKCSDYPSGLPVWPDNLSAFANDSSGVVVGTIINPDAYNMNWKVGDNPPRIQISDVLKGNGLHKGTTLELCGNTGSIEFVGDSRTVLVFLDGKNQGIWVPLQGDIGIISQANDRKFNREWADGSKTSATIDNLKSLIK